MPADLCSQGNRLEAFLAGSLAGEEAIEFSLHLDGCPSCQLAAESRVSRAVWSDLLVEPLSPVNPVTGRPDAETNLGQPLIDPGGIAPSIDVGSRRLLADRYELRGTVGMGGCGAVFSAWDRVLRRDVAVKSPHWQLGESKSVRRRFAVEARAAARLSHPNIVPVYEARIEDGEECFLVSELIRGPSLLEWLETKWSDGDDVGIRDAALLMAALADGVEFAHKAGVLHRDLKPSNVMLAPAPAGELPFTPRITDFGLAQLTDSATKSTADGGVRGSLPYMAPERFTGHHEVRSPSDVYALGVILYELLTGEAPIQAETPAGLVAAIPVQPIPRLRGRRSDVPRDLEAICLKCLEKLPARRYPSAAALAADLRRFLAGEVVTARLPHAGEQAARWIARHPSVALVMTTIAIAATAFVVVLAFANEQKTNLIGKLEESQTELQGANQQLKSALQTADDMRNQADAMRRQADRMRHMAERQQRATQESLYVSEFRRAMQAWQERDLPAVQRILDALDGPAFAPFRGIECDWLRTKLVRPHRELTRMGAAIYTIACSHDGELLAAAGKDSVVRLVRYADGVTVREWPTEQREVNGVAFSPDDSRVWTTGDDGTVCQWEVATGKELLRVAAHAPEQAHDLTLSTELNLLVSSGTDGRVCLWDAMTGQSKGSWKAHEKAVVGVVIDAARRRLLTSGRDCKLGTWDLAQGTRIQIDNTWSHIPSASLGLRSRDGAVHAFGKRMEFWLASGQVHDSLGFVDDVKVVVEHPTDPRVFAIDVNGVLYDVPVVDVVTPVPARSTRSIDTKPETRLHAGRTYAARISPDQSSLVTCGGDGAVRSWPLETLNPNDVAFADEPSLHTILSSTADGNAIFVTTKENSLAVVDVYDLSIEEIGPLTKGRKVVRGRVAPDGSLLIIEADETGQSWLVRHDPASGEVLHEVRMGSVGDGPSEIRLDARLGLLVANDFHHPYCHFFASDSIEPLPPFRMRLSPDTIDFSSDSSLLAVSQLRRIEVYEVTSRELVWTQPTPAGIHQLLFVDDEHCLLSATADRVIRKWNARDGSPLCDLTGHRSAVTWMMASRDGRTLITGSYGGEVMFWHLATGELLAELDLELNGVGEMFLSPAEDRLVIFQHGANVHSIPLRP